MHSWENRRAIIAVFILGPGMLLTALTEGIVRNGLLPNRKRDALAHCETISRSLAEGVVFSLVRLKSKFGTRTRVGRVMLLNGYHQLIWRKYR